MAKQSKCIRFEDKFEVEDCGKIYLTVQDDQDRFIKQNVSLDDDSLTEDRIDIDNFEIDLPQRFFRSKLIITSESITAFVEDHSIVINYIIKCGEDEQRFSHPIDFDKKGQTVVVRETIELKEQR